jgi:hypothetical protein
MRRMGTQHRPSLRLLHCNTVTQECHKAPGNSQRRTTTQDFRYKGMSGHQRCPTYQGFGAFLSSFKVCEPIEFKNEDHCLLGWHRIVCQESYVLQIQTVSAFSKTRYHIPKYNEFRAGSEVLTAVVMKSSVFRNITSCSPLQSTIVSEERVVWIFRVEE